MQASRFEQLLVQLGWQVESEVGEGLVAVVPGALLHCMDGRPIANASEVLARGPKVQGGVLGVAELLGVNLRQACGVVRLAGFVPAVHGHCGYAELKGIDVAKAAKIVKSAGGKYVEVVGEHTEQYLRVNLRRHTTMVPQGEAFQVDLWVAGRLGIDPEAMLTNAAKTIEALKWSKVAKVVV